MLLKKILLSISAAAAMFASSASTAGVYQIDFTASDFRDMARRVGGQQSPFAEISGSFRYRMADIMSPYIDELLAASLVIDGYAYGLSTVTGAEGGDGAIMLGGTITGADSITPLTNDFWLIASADPSRVPVSASFAYTTQATTTAWSSRTVKYTVTEIPEPASIALVMLSFAGLAVARRRSLAA